MNRRSRLLAIAMSLFTLTAHAGAADSPPEAAPPGAAGSTISGTVTNVHTRKPIVGAEVTIVGTPRLARTDAQGRFSLEGLPAGTHLVSARATGYGSKSMQVPVDGVHATTIDVPLDVQFHEAGIVVTASVEPRDPLQVYQPTTTLGRSDIEKQGAVSLGMTLEKEPGVSSSSMGNTTARPVIRGLGGDRVLILEDGIGNGDVSSISPDHAVVVDPAAAESIEVVRGPANLLYGSNAIGGVINVINNEVPTRLAGAPTGSILIGGNTNANEFSTSADVTASAGPVALRVGASHRQGGEFEFPGGVAGNSQYDVSAGNIGASLVGEAGVIGLSYRRYEADYGIPVSEDGDLLPAGADGVTLRPEQTSWRLLGQITRPFGGLQGGRIQVVRRNYEHPEIEDTGDVGTMFDQDSTEARADFTQKTRGPWKGAFGVQYLDRDFTAVGDEVLVPEALTRGYGVFTYQEIVQERMAWSFGARFEDQKVEQAATGTDRTFSDLSGAVGAIVTLSSPLRLAINLTRSFKVPSAEELFANGPHIATFAFEMGDPDLNEETSVGADVSLRFQSARLEGELTFFKTRFRDFIFSQDTGLVDGGSGLPIFAFTQADADFQGIEWHTDINLREHLILELLADMVRAQNNGTDEPLPRMPPARVGVGLTWQSDTYFVTGEVRGAARQDRIAPGETETGGYALYNLYGGVTFTRNDLVHRVVLRAENLTDHLYRNSVSVVKDLVPQPGRNIQVGYSLLF